MKIKSLEIKNIGKIKNEVIDFNKSLNLFYGEIMTGKTTILNSVKLCFGGSFPQDLIQHGEKEAFVKLKFDTGSIERSFYFTKDGKIKSRPIVFINDGEIEKKPVKAIEKFLNPFLLDQNHLVNMAEAERTKYFVELFGVDTKEQDEKLKDLESKAKDLRVKIKMYGEINLEEVESPDIDTLQKEQDKIDAENKKISVAYNEKIKENNKYNENVLFKNNERKRGIEKTEENKNQIEEFKQNIIILENKNKKIFKWLDENPEMKKESHPDIPVLISDSEIKEKISNSKADKIKYDQYQENLKTAEEKTADEAELKSCVEKQKEIKKQKVATLEKISENSKIKGLSFDENGNFTYNGTAAGMLSTSQLMTLSSQLSELYPSSFSIELIDRGESLGKSIFKFIDKANREDKTILATIVGEKPADIPEEIGVFVVENGKINK